VKNLSTALNFEMVCMHTRVYMWTQANVHTACGDLMSLLFFFLQRKLADTGRWSCKGSWL